MKFAYVFITVAAILALWFSRLVWLQAPDPAYVQDLFDHSQWRFPLSTRIISDEQLYQHAGLYLIKTGDLFTVNPEVPPLAKYMYGASFQYFGNPYAITPLLLFFVLVLYFAISRELQLSRQTSLWITGILLITPLVFGQLTQTMLDLPQLVWLLGHIYFLIRIRTQKRVASQVVHALIAGLFLGAFAASKVPLLAPGLVLAAIVYLWRLRKLWLIGVIGVASAGVYMGSYWPYFAAGHSIREWLGTQKWMFEFYRQSRVEAHSLLFPISVISGWYQGWWDQPWQRIVEWSVIWPISIVAPFVLLRQWWTKKAQPTLEVQYLTLLTLALIAIHFVIPFWPRYFLLLLPLCLLAWPIVLKTSDARLRKWLQVAGVLVLVAHAIWFGRPSPYQTLNLAVEQWEKGHYQDLYQSISPGTKPTDTASEYHRAMKKVEYSLSRPKIEMLVPRTWPWQSSVPVTLSSTYQTPLGEYSHSATVTAIRVGSRWAIEWSWDAVLPNFAPDDAIIYLPDYPEFGKLTSSNGVLISEEGLIPTLSVIPKDVEAEPTLREVAEVTDTQFNELVAKVYVESINDWVTPIGKIDPYSEVVPILKTRPGIIWVEMPGRVINPLLSTPDARKWAKSRSDHYNQLDGQLGGVLMLARPNREPHVLIEKEVVNGEDVIDTESFQPALSNQ
jgi:hypothetical protein